MKDKFVWRKNDYFWIIGILVSVILIISSVRLSDNSDVVSIISLIASCVSICLAFVAIGQSLFYNSQSTDLYQKMVTKIMTIESNTNDLNNQLNNITEKLTENIGKTIEKSPLSEKQKIDVLDAMDDAINSTNINFNSGYNKPNAKFYSAYNIENALKDNFEKNSGSYKLLSANQSNDNGTDFILENNISIFIISYKVMKNEMSRASEYHRIKLSIDMLKATSEKIESDKKKYQVVMMCIENECKISVSYGDIIIRKKVLIEEIMNNSINLVNVFENMIDVNK